MPHASTERDHVDRVREKWKKEAPEWDTSPISIVARLGRAATYVDVYVESALGEFGLTREAWDILASLRRTGPPYSLSPTDLYRGLMRTSGAITTRLQILEKRGLITRVVNQEDRRGLLVKLTEKGLELTRRVGPVHLENERRLLSVLNEVEQEQLANLLRKLLLSFESQGPSPPVEKEWWTGRSKRKRSSRDSS